MEAVLGLEIENKASTMHRNIVCTRNAQEIWGFPSSIVAGRWIWDMARER
jgi:hypothetical protein